MNLKEKIQKDLYSALKEKDENRASTLRFLNAQILNREKEKRFKLAKGKEAGANNLANQSNLTDEEIIEVMMSEIKKRKEAILAFEKGNRKDLAEKERKEIDILRGYLPEQLPEEEVRKMAEETIKKIGAKDIKEMGKVMKELSPQIKGRAEGGLVSKIVKEFLS
ncbi:MAG: GatB/YqeY domain-containing protein [Candidatus Nealsonbacteria bacterium]|nr:GatB/YqeY domain-containing protein [Candidatus Nealsonbacteria bacterium]